jgi:hypothetical protein
MLVNRRGRVRLVLVNGPGPRLSSEHSLALINASTGS